VPERIGQKAYRYWMLRHDLKPGKSKAKIHTAVQLSDRYQGITSVAVNFPAERNGSSLPITGCVFHTVFY